MITLTYNVDAPVGEVLINLPTLGIMAWNTYITSFLVGSKKDVESIISLYEKKYKTDENKILVAYYDNSYRGNAIRYNLKIYEVNELNGLTEL